MPKLLKWLDKHLLFYLSLFLLAFIPLYPKLPLFDLIPGYIVRVRAEDFAIAFTFMVWLIQAIRGRVKWKNPLFFIILSYAVVGLLSSLSAMFITKTLPLEWLHVGKMFLHYFRYLEYFTLLFIAYSAITTKKQAIITIICLAATMIGVSVYGYGQKYLYWPVYSTMNREFSKGMRLYLTEHARVPSTFGGHYDLAAYTMVVITVILALFFLTQSKRLKLLFGSTFLLAFWLLILTASRTSFLAYLFAITALMFIFIFVKGFFWSLPRYLLVMLFSMFIMLSFGDLSERFAQVIGLDKIKEKYSELAFLPKAKVPDNAMSTDELTEIAKVTVSSDQPPSRQKPLPGDVYEDIPLTVTDQDGGTRVISRTYSENAYKYGLSAAIRFDALWPRAIEGFKKNPLLGSGYSTLTKESFGQFTEAESTDNNFLRTLGETGLLGLITFYGVIIYGLYLIIKNLKNLSSEPLFVALGVGMVAGSLGLLLNASYIDVFAASKVAQTYWAFLGLTLAIIYEVTPKPVKTAKKASKSNK